MRLRLGIVSETSERFLNQVKLCLFSFRKNAGEFSHLPVTLITNSESIPESQKCFFLKNFAPLEFKTSPRLGAIPHTSKLNVFYAIEPSTYDVLLYLDCDTVVRRPLDRIIEPVVKGEADFLCRRGGDSDRGNFVDFDALVAEFCGPENSNTIMHEGTREWPMFNSGVFAGTSLAIQKIRKDAIEFTYRLFNEWQRTDALGRLPAAIRQSVQAAYPDDFQFKQRVSADWTLEQGALALACIKAGIAVRYLEDVYNSWGGDDAFRILHCFKSLYDFNRRDMYSDASEAWINEYGNSDIPGKQFLADIMTEFKRAFQADNRA